MSRHAFLSCLLLFVGGCRFDSFRFYDVTRTVIEECDIRPNGEFCDVPEQFSPPQTEVWAVERAGDEVRVFVDKEVWVADPLDEDDDPNFVFAAKREIASRAPGPCITTNEESIELVADDSQLTGTLIESNRIEGAEACGPTPSGLRRRSRLDGTFNFAP